MKVFETFCEPFFVC